LGTMRHDELEKLFRSTGLAGALSRHFIKAACPHGQRAGGERGEGGDERGLAAVATSRSHYRQTLADVIGPDSGTSWKPGWGEMIAGVAVRAAQSPGPGARRSSLSGSFRASKAVGSDDSRFAAKPIWPHTPHIAWWATRVSYTRGTPGADAVCLHGGH
jgi:hypothetical protein